jgi:hypothetical protein
MAQNKREVERILRARQRELEMRDREAYLAESEECSELSDWESEAVWPKDYPLFETPQPVRRAGPRRC